MEVGERVVAPEERIVAQATVERASAKLGIKPPAIKWFDREGEGERKYAAQFGWRDWSWWPGDARLMGLYVRPLNEIWVRIGLGVEETAATVAHEVKHAAQEPLVAGVSPSRTGREAAAESWARNYLAAVTATDLTKGAA